MDTFFKIMFVIVMVFTIAETGASLKSAQASNKHDVAFYKFLDLIILGFVLAYGIYRYGGII